MTVTIHRPPAAHEPDSAPPVRLSLKPEGPLTGYLDGAWWPRSRDLNRELPALAKALDPLWGRIARITVNPRHWPVIPRKVPVAGHVVKVGWFTAEQDPHELLLLPYGNGRRELLVIPPRTGPAAAGRLMTAATDLLHPLTASALMAAEEARRGAAEAEGGSQDPEDDWVSEGGAFTPSMATPARRTRPTTGI
jgi:Family of unknown function (DUF5994)